MGVLDYIFDSDWRQRADIEALKRQNRRIAHRRGTQTADLASRVKELEDAVGSLALLCRGLMGLLEKQDLWDEEAFKEICRQIDAADGSEDGKTPLPGK